MADFVKEFDTQCKKAVEHYKVEVGRLRSGRASVSMLEGIHVSYYGSSVPLSQLGTISAPEPRMLTIQTYDAGAIEEILKAIRSADLGLNPSNEGGLVRVIVPALNEERRKDLIKKLHKMAEEAKISLRNHRRDTIDAIKKAQSSKQLNEDESRKKQEETQKTIDKYTKDIDTLTQAKEKEMLEV